MNKGRNNLTKRQCFLLISSIVSLVLFLVFLCFSGYLKSKPYAQQLAKRWADGNEVAQISVFVSPKASLNEEQIVEFGHKIDTSLVEAAITSESENASARLWIGAYSAYGKVQITGKSGNVTVDAYGVGGDYFQFHPLKLIYGSYFSGSDLMQDHIIIDEDAAWKLFGSSDVVGQYVTIGNIPHMIVGVVQREHDYMAKKAGVTSSIAYVSYNSLEKYGTHNGINCIEILMPNPVNGYAYNYISENIGIEEKEREVIENSDRYSIKNMLKIIASFPTRSMNTKAILYSFWENIARGYEDLLVVIFIFEFLFIFYPFCILLVNLVIKYRRRTWKAKDILHFFEKKKDLIILKLKQNKKKEKGEKKI